MAEEITNPVLPQVYLRNLQFPLQVLALVPLETVEKYQVAAFEVNDKQLKMAIVYPEQLKQGFYIALQDIAKKIDRNVELFRTDHASMQALIVQYRAQLADSRKPVSTEPKDDLPKPSPVQPAEAPLVPPPLFELGKSVAFSYLKRIPVDYGIQHHLICVDFVAPNTYWLFSDRVNSPSTKEIVSGIEKYNKILVHLIPATPKDFKDLLTYYERQQDTERSRLAEEQRLAEQAIPTVTLKQVISESEQSGPSENIEKARVEKPVETTVQPIVEDEVVVPKTRATILSQENELFGVAGFLQRVTQQMGVKQGGLSEVKIEPKI